VDYCKAQFDSGALAPDLRTREPELA